MPEVVARERSSRAQTRTAPPAARPRSEGPPRRASGGGTILLPPWARAPWLGFRQPAVLLAVIGAAAILACAGSSAALFLSSASSKALQQFVAARCQGEALPSIGVTTPGQFGRNGPYDNTQYTKVNEAAYTAATSAGLPRPYQQLVATDQPQAGPLGGTPAPASLFYSAHALASVDQLSSVGGQGVWISDDAAKLWKLRPGGRLPIASTGPSRLTVRVVGIYKDLKNQPTKPFWCARTNLYQNPGVGSDSRQKLLIFTSASQFIAVDHRIHDSPTMQWISPMHDQHLTVSKAQQFVRDEKQAKGELNRTVQRIGAPGTLTTSGTELNALINQTHLIRRGLTGPVVPIAIGGSVLALLLIGAAGSYWADRRAREVRLLSSRGVGPGALAVKAALELTAPAVIGTALGWALAIGLVKWLGPSSDLDHQAPITAAWTALIGLACGVLLLSLVAGLRARNATERPVGHRRGWVAVVPWELLVLAGAAALFIRLRGEHGVTLVNDIAQVNLLLVAFPLVFLAGGAALVVRLIAFGLPLVRRASARWPAAGYFAVRRITGAPIVSVVLLAAASMPVAVLVYSGAITSTSRTSVDAKASVYAGSNVSVSTVDSPHRTAAVDKVGTILTRYSDVKLGDADAEVLAIDPDTFARAAYWDDRLDSASLQSLLNQLKQHPSDGRLPAIVLRYTNGHFTDLHMNTTRKSLDIITSPKAFPGQRDQYSDLIVVDAARLGRVDPMVANFHEVWSKGSQAAAEAAMRAQGARPLFVTTPQSTIKSSNYLAVTWTFGYLEALAALVGLIAVGGLLLYLATRQRSRTASYAMARRMGMSARSHLRSLVIELGALLVAAWVVGAGLAMIAVLMVYERLDVDPTRRPSPLLTLPVAAWVGSGIAVVVVAVVAAWSAQRSAGRADVSEVMRLDA